MDKTNMMCAVKTKTCTGCGACKNICPKGAISMQFNAEGFYSPVVDETLCINCGKCEKVCPASRFETKNIVNPVCYAVAANDEIRKNSTSGGLFTVLAKYILNKGGYVAGVAWNKNFEAENIIIDNENDLQKLRFSKYVQATTGDTFKKIKEILENDKFVLFSGTPCQVAGLLNFLGKNYEKLITLDLICHGAPSPKVWQDYLAENFEKDKIVDINFRDKDKGWIKCDNCDSKVIYDNGENVHIEAFFRAFLGNKLTNEPCLECKYRSVPRPADFTCGDFWYLYQNEINDKKGLSVCLLNNKKAEKIFKEIKYEFRLVEKINLKRDYSKIEFLSTSRKNLTRNIFFKKYKEGRLPVSKLLNAAVSSKYDVGFVSMFNSLNYGSALVAYAVNDILENLGYSVLNIHKRRSTNYEFDNFHKSYQFAKKHYFLSREYSLLDDHRQLNVICDNFVLGSDTLWWWDDVYLTDNYYWLDFVTSDKRKISFCTSFSFDEPSIPQNKFPELKYLYKRINSLSVREESGVKILKDYFDCDGVHLLDPVLVANPQIYHDLANESDRKDKNYILVYVLDMTSEKEKHIQKLAAKLNLAVINIPQMHKAYREEKEQCIKTNVEIEDFVCLIKNASYVITDSFHGTCFSLIFRKKFVSIKNMERGGARYKLFEDLNLTDRLINSYDELDDFNIDKDIDYKYAQEQINIRSNSAIAWLKDALTKEMDEPDKNDLLYDVFCIEKQKRIKKELENKKDATDNYKTIIRRAHSKILYLKYRLLSNFVVGKTKERYTKKKNMYKNQ